ncbi:response regulator transcription factor [Feifania hominis]|uniref:Stage 0 sporulation protein A homolog n=1 Tax=Feifania hominis TaxID=2763660 RepID=A0A926DER1_9FIRM|nr:response regulator transcription factor [Feifania hominis]MBC8535680.1 response regulator transcription factor [Feifania hominis]
MATILIADDEERIRRLVSDFLKKDGYEVLQAEDGRQAMELIEKKGSQIDLTILDIMMPYYDGWSVLRYIRGLKNDMPVVMLTARNEEVDEVLGFELGADDYVGKPFSPMVLLARIRAILKRRAEQAPPRMSAYGNLEIDESKREVRISGRPVALTPKEYELLLYLSSNRNVAISRENILSSVWGYDYFGDLRTVDTHVKNLRAKLQDNGTLITTVRGYGYRFEPEARS